MCVGVRALKRALQIPILITYIATPDARAAGTRTHTGTNKIEHHNRNLYQYLQHTKPDSKHTGQTLHVHYDSNLTHNGTDSMNVFGASTILNSLICLMWVSLYE